MSSSWGSPQWAAAARVVRRAGFGARGEDVDAAVRDGIPAWLDRELGADQATDPGAVATPPPSLTFMTAAQIKADRAAARRQGEALLAWWLRRMAAVEHPLVERLTFGWHAHFATSIEKVRSAPLMLAQNELLRAQGRGRFPALAEAILTDPAMLVWLDGLRNTRQAPNENLAREFMELFTLGVGGGYTETDVREGARALTGWTVDAGAARFVAARHDGGSKTVLGTTGRLDAAGFARAVLAQPAWRTHVATRWWRELAAPADPDPTTLTRLVAALGDGELAPLIRTVLTDPAFGAATGTLVVSPVEWALGAIRSLRVDLDDQAVLALTGGLRRLGQVPFLPPNVSGWPSGQAWLSTASAATRSTLAVALAGRAADGPALRALTDVSATDRPDVAAHLLGIPSLTARTRGVLRATAGDPGRILAALLVSPEYLVH